MNQLSTRLAVCLLASHGLLLAWSGYQHSPTIDEPAHLAAGISHWRFGRTDLYTVNPPLVRMVAAVPVMLVGSETRWWRFRNTEAQRVEFDVGRAFADANGPRIFWLTTLARWACIPFSLIGGWVCFLWARELFGYRSGLLALTLWIFSPTILGNGALITADVPAAAVCVTTVFSFQKWLKNPTWSNTFVTGVSLGVALLTKSSLVLLCGCLTFIWVVDRVARARQLTAANTAGLTPVRVELQRLICFLSLAFLILNLGFGFEGTGRPLRSYSFRSETLGATRVGPRLNERGNRFADTWMGHVPVPLPCNYLIGIDAQKVDFEHGLRSYLNGEVKTNGDGWWWFYLYAITMKMPVGTGLLGVLALFQAIRTGFKSQFILLVPAVFYFALVSSQVGLNYFRYLLPAFPFAFIWISQVVSVNAQHARWSATMCTLAMCWSIGSSLWYYPHSLSYFNELCGGPTNGYRIMADANLDWGQDLIYLQQWLDENPSVKGLELSYYGPIAPAVAGIDVHPVSRREREHLAPDRIAAAPNPHWMAISVTRLAHQKALQASVRREHSQTSAATSWHEYLFNQKPDVRIGYTIHLYRMTRDTTER